MCGSALKPFVMVSLMEWCNVWFLFCKTVCTLVCEACGSELTEVCGSKLKLCVIVGQTQCCSVCVVPVTCRAVCDCWSDTVVEYVVPVDLCDCWSDRVVQCVCVVSVTCRAVCDCWSDTVVQCGVLVL